MSDTDKDKPYWVDAAWYPEHSIRCRAGRAACDLPPARPKRATRWQPGNPRCEWQPEYGYRRWATRYPPPAWFIRHVWTSPDRQGVRRECRAAAAEHRAGEPVTVPRTGQHRHGAGWLWY